MITVEILETVIPTPRKVSNTSGIYIIFPNNLIYSKNSNKFLKPTLNENGYFYINLVVKKGISKPHYMHRLLGFNFLINPKNLPFINHKDGDKQNCSLGNLEWCTCSHNTTHGYRVIGRKSAKGNSSLTTTQISSIKSLINEGYQNYEISVKFNIDSSHVSRIKNGKRWPEVKPYIIKPK